MQQTRGNAAVQRLVQRASGATAPAQPVVQRGPEEGSAPPPTGTPPPTPSAEKAPASGPPILFGLDTTENLLYASVIAPGHTVTEIVSYIYLFPELMLDQFWSENPGLPDNPDELVPTGRNLRIPDGRPTDQAARDRDVAMKSGGLLRTEGMEAGDTGAMRYTFSAAGTEYQLTEGQLRGMLLNLQRNARLKAQILAGSARFSLKTQRDFVDETNRVVRWISGGEMPGDSEWEAAIKNAEGIRDVVARLDLSSDLTKAARIVQNMTNSLEVVAQHIDHLERRLRDYFGDTIEGAEGAVSKLEVVRDASFAVAGSIGMVVAAPVAVATAGTVLGTSAAGTVGAMVIGGTSTYYGVRSAVGAVRGTANLAGQALANEGDVDAAEVDQETMAGFKGTSWDAAADLALLALTAANLWRQFRFRGSGGERPGGPPRQLPEGEPSGEGQPGGSGGSGPSGAAGGKSTTPGAAPASEATPQTVANPKSGGSPPPPSALIVGAERPDEFAHAADLARRGQNVTVANPRVTEAARNYQAQGGTLHEGPVEGLPPGKQYDYIREEFPQPLGRTMAAVDSIKARLERVAPGGRLEIVTEGSAVEFRELYESIGNAMRFKVTTRPLAPTEGPHAPGYIAPTEEKYLTTFERPSEP